MVTVIAILAIVSFGIWLATRKDPPSDTGMGGGSKSSGNSELQ